jgi:CHAT domain-containing protein
LPGVEDEVAALSRTLARRGARLAQRLNAEATEGSLRSEALSGYGLLYFATHAVLPGTSRCINEPALALSLPNGSRSRDDDGLLEASEVASLQLDADLVVLSACNTASRSTSLSGESLTGLAQAFFSAGARKVLATHWPVESRRTAELMASVFRAQRAPDYGDIADALRDAQIAMLRSPETSHPWFWAAYTVLGTGPRQERQ